MPVDHRGNCAGDLRIRLSRVSLDFDRALERALSEGNEWQSWRALRLSGETPDGIPAVPGQEELGGFVGPTGRPSPGATGATLAHLAVIGADRAAPAVVAADWLMEIRTPAGAWLDAPDDVPGVIDDYAAGRVWATASAIAGLLVMNRDPGVRAIDLLRGEADQEGHFTGGAYATFSAAAACWLAEGARSETAEWALRWAREWAEEWWGPRDRVAALILWAAAGIPPEHPSVEDFLDAAGEGASPEGWADLDLTLDALEVFRRFGL